MAPSRARIDDSSESTHVLTAIRVRSLSSSASWQSLLSWLMSGVKGSAGLGASLAVMCVCGEGAKGPSGLCGLCGVAGEVGSDGKTSAISPACSSSPAPTPPSTHSAALALSLA